MDAANIKVKVIEFVHTSCMTDADEETFHFIDEKWRNINPKSPWANVTFEENSIPEIEWWS